MNVTVDESLYDQDQENEDYKVKEGSIFYGPDEEDIDNHHENPDPFLLQDTKIMTGQGKAIVCCVGENTML